MHLIFLALLLFARAAAADDELCGADTKVGVVPAATACGVGSKATVPCSCDVRTLRPLQGALGMEEVRDKADKIKAKPGKECRKLASDPIKVVRGPGGALFITDHHHGADAWLLAERPFALCEIADRAPASTEAEFWSDLTRDHLVRLADANGKLPRVRPFAWPATRRAAAQPRRGLAGDFWIGASCFARSAGDSDASKPRSASTSLRRERRTSRGKRGSSPISNRDAASSVIHTGRHAKVPSS
jgi:hypothetical protein